MFRFLSLAATALLALGQTASAADRRVVVITLDGFPAYYLDDPEVDIPVIRGLRDAGASTEAGMRVSNPSVTWPNHTTLMTGVHPAKHGVIYNGMPERHGVGEPVTVTRDKIQKELVRVPLLFDVLKKAGMRSAALDWPGTVGSTSLDDQIPVVAKRVENATPELKAELQRAGLIKKYNVVALSTAAGFSRSASLGCWRFTWRSLTRSTTRTAPTRPRVARRPNASTAESARSSRRSTRRGCATRPRSSSSPTTASSPLIRRSTPTPSL